MAKRNQDLERILQDSAKKLTGLPSHTVDVVSQTDHVFVLGDLNYRLAPRSNSDRSDLVYRIPADDRNVDQGATEASEACEQDAAGPGGGG